MGKPYPLTIKAGAHPLPVKVKAPPIAHQYYEALARLEVAGTLDVNRSLPVMHVYVGRFKRQYDCPERRFMLRGLTPQMTRIWRLE